MIERLHDRGRVVKGQEERAHVAPSPGDSTVPEETRRVARAAFPRGNIYMRLRDELGAIDHDQLFAALFLAVASPRRRPGALP
jgi:hypothetical protein